MSNSDLKEVLGVNEKTKFLEVEDIHSEMPGEKNPGLLVCLPLTDPLLRPDNVTGVCFKCEADVQLHINASSTNKKKLCFDCFKIAAANPKSKLTIGLTREQRDMLAKLGINFS